MGPTPANTGNLAYAVALGWAHSYADGFRY